MTPDFHRIRRLPPYVFEEVNRIKARLRARGTDIIDFGMGNPDMPTPKHIVDKLIETARDPKAGRYSASKGIIGLRRAMAGYYDRRFGVKLNPDTEVIATLGSKEGFANLAQALTAPGDVIICPNPAYPIHAYGFIMAGGVIRHVPALSPEEYLSGISRAMKHSAPPPSVLIVLSVQPDGPVGRPRLLQGGRGPGEEARPAGAVRHRLFEIYFDNNPPPSILQVEGAKDIAVEVNSLSKTYAMAGWRVGMVVGNARICAALARVKSYLDYGAYHPDPGGRRRGAERPAGLRRRDPRHLQEPPRHPGVVDGAPAGTFPRRPPRCSPGRRSPKQYRRPARCCSPSC
jgi:alanine-synthesizing transaminase